VFLPRRAVRQHCTGKWGQAEDVVQFPAGEATLYRK